MSACECMSVPEPPFSVADEGVDACGVVSTEQTLKSSYFRT